MLQICFPYVFVTKGSFSMYVLEVLKPDYGRVLMLLDELKEDLQPSSMERHGAQCWGTSATFCYATGTS